MSTAVKELGCREEAEGFGFLLLPLSRLQQLHAKSSLPLLRVAGVAAALLGAWMLAGVHDCVHAALHMLPQASWACRGQQALIFSPVPWGKEKKQFGKENKIKKK